MNEDRFLEVETMLKRIAAELDASLRWKWDDRFKTTLLEFKTDNAGKVHGALIKELKTVWDAKTISKAAKIVKKIPDSMGGLRDRQQFYALETAAMVLFCAWWPWGDGQCISARVGIKLLEPGEAAPAEVETLLKKCFNI